jgi:2-methylisocitrate lyase-like PEP mutase family enzyme
MLFPHAQEGSAMSSAQFDKGNRFRALHAADTFLIGNCFDGGSARVLSGLGFKALATSSAASAGTLGRLDGQVTRDEALAHARVIAGATPLPVSADLENGFGDEPSVVAETILRAATTGLVGASIEDYSGNAGRSLYPLEQAAERIAAAAEAAKGLGFPFTLTARAENFLRGNPNLEDTIRRLQAYERAGADVLFAPGLPDLASIRAVCSSLSKPVNFMVGIPGKSFSVPELREAGVRRISLAGTLSRAARGGLLGAAREALEQGTFGFVESSATSREVSKFLSGS